MYIQRFDYQRLIYKFFFDSQIFFYIFATYLAATSYWDIYWLITKYQN